MDTTLKMCAELNDKNIELKKYKEAIFEIENIMERWHVGREEDLEALQAINDNLVNIGLLYFFNKK